MCIFIFHININIYIYNKYKYVNIYVNKYIFGYIVINSLYKEDFSCAVI